MKNITISIEDNTNAALEFLSQELGISKQQIVRKALDNDGVNRVYKYFKDNMSKEEYDVLKNKNNNIKSNNKDNNKELDFNKIFEMWVQKKEITFKKLLSQYCKEENLIIYEKEWNKKTNNSPMNKSFNKLEKDLKKKDFVFNENTMSFSNQIPGQMCIEKFIPAPNNNHESNNELDELDELDESFDDDDYIHEGPAPDIY